MGEEQSYRESKEEQKIQETSSVESSLRQALEAISSLISLSHSIKVFSGKWQAIRGKLEELLTGLKAIENFDISDNPSLSFTFQAIVSTFDECHSLAKSCIFLSYSGKLLMKSDLDIVLSKLTSHIKSLSDVYDVGLLSHNFAIVVSRPGLSASREDMKFYVRDLLSRLKIGSFDMKKQALVAFNEVIKEDDRYIKIATEIDSSIILLVNFLDSQEIEIQEEAAKAVSVISGLESNKSLFVGVGIIPPLVRVLENGSKLGKQFAARCLLKMTENSDNAWSVSSHGGVTALLKICSKFDSGGEMVGLVCGVLKNLLGVEEIMRFMLDEGIISVLIKLVKSKEEVSLISSMDLLQTMASGDDSIRQMIRGEDGIYLLVGFLDPKSTVSTKVREMALKAVMNLCFSSESCLKMLMDYGFLDHILHFLGNGEFSVQELALKASFWLCGTSEEAKKSMGEAGFIPELVKFLDSRSFEVQAMAAEALSGMVLNPKNKKRFVENDQNVSLLLKSLNPEDPNPGNRKLLLSLLSSLTNSNRAKKKIINSGYIENIRKLAEAEIPEAKTIVRKLSCNKLRTMLSGIWHS